MPYLVEPGTWAALPALLLAGSQPGEHEGVLQAHPQPGLVQQQEALQLLLDCGLLLSQGALQGRHVQGREALKI